MKCPNCHRIVEADAAFCGNCGQAQRPAAIYQQPQVPVSYYQSAQTLYPSQVPQPPQAVNSHVPQAQPQSQPTTFGPPPSSTAQALPHSPIAARYNNQAQPAPEHPQQQYPAAGLTGTDAPQLPGYALPTAHQHYVKVTIVIVLGVIGIPASFFAPVIGLVFGAAGIILGTLTESGVGKKLKILAIVLAALSILSGLGSWVHFVVNDQRIKTSPTSSGLPSNASASTGSSVSTPCYDLRFNSQLTVEHASGSCEIEAYNGSTADSSSDVLKVLSTTTATVNASNLSTFAKTAIEKDVSQNLPDFSITSEKSGNFAGSPAYFVNASNNTTNVSVVEAAVFHTTSTANFFILVHATQGSTTNLNAESSEWNWN